MKHFLQTILKGLLVLSPLLFFGQEITTIRVSVPDKTDEVFISGNQENLGNWQADKVKMKKISDYEREVSLNLSFKILKEELLLP